MEKTFFISADIEGITDVTFWSETEEGQEGYEAARAQMTREVAAPARRCWNPANLPVVRDGHGNARNISHLDLPEKTVLMRGWACHPGSMMAGLSAAYSGVLYIGYHAPAGSDGSPPGPHRGPREGKVGKGQRPFDVGVYHEFPVRSRPGRPLPLHQRR